MAKELLTVDEAADYLAVHPMTVYRWCREGRLPAAKLGAVWRIRRAALDDLLRRGAHHQTLVGQLQEFLRVPDDLIAVAETKELLHRLDAAFFQVGEARGGVLVKYYAGEPASADELRVAFSRHGLAVGELERAGRFRFSEEQDPLGGRAAALRRLLDALAGDDRTIWAVFDWVAQVDLAEAERQQAALQDAVDTSRLVVKISVLGAVADEWSAAEQRRAREAHSGMIWLSAGGIILSRRASLPPT